MKIASPTILVVDDETNVIESFKLFLEDKYNLLTVTSGEEALEKIEKENINLVLLDILMPGMSGLEVLSKIKEKHDDIDVIMITAIKTVRTAIQAMKLGAYDYITKPFDVDEVLNSIQRVLEKQNLFKEVTYLREEVNRPFLTEKIIGISEKMRRVYEMVLEVSKTDSTVLISGETGTGKELIARAIHLHSARKDKPFIPVDCASIPENLLESELFGHEKGAFTDATTQKLGRFELANGGTLFLDEIGNLKLDMQSKILRAIEEREIQRVGGIKSIKVDVHIVSATNIDLKEAMKQGKFREDLYYRVNVIPISLPSLFERKEDIPFLIDHFLQIYNREFGKNIKGVTKEALDYLVNYKWPGNVRELRNIIERLVALSKEKEEVITHKRLPLDILLAPIERVEGVAEKISFKAAREQFEREFIIKVLEKANWNQVKAAKLLGIHRNTLIFKMRNLSIKIPKA